MSVLLLVALPLAAAEVTTEAGDTLISIS